MQFGNVFIHHYYILKSHVHIQYGGYSRYVVFTIKIKANCSILFALILQEYFVMLLAAKVLIIRCIKPKSVRSKMPVLPHKFSDVSLTNNTMPYTQCATGLSAPI